MELQKKQQTNWKGNFMYIVRETHSANMGNSKVNKVFKQPRYNSEHSQTNRKKPRYNSEHSQTNDTRKLGL